MTDLNKVNFMSKTRFDNLSVTNDDELYLVETNIAVDEEVVHNTGAETIAGNKTFSNNVVVTGTTTLNNALTVNANTKITGALQVDNDLIIRYVSDYNQLSIRNSENKDGNYGYNRIELMPLSTDNYGGYIDFHYAGSTDDYTSRIIENETGRLSYIGTHNQSASSSTTETTIAVKGWVNDPAKSTNVVHRSGNEAIVGVKAFSDVVKANAGVRMEGITTTSGAEGLRDVVGIDTNNARVGGLRFIHQSDNSRRVTLYICKTDNTNVAGLSIGLSDDDTTVFTSCPTPSSLTDNSSQIATTAWVNSKIQFVNALPASPVNGVLYLIPET